MNPVLHCSHSASQQIKNRRICLIGFMAVGKSSIAAQYAQATYSDAYLPTIENTYDKLFQVCAFVSFLERWCAMPTRVSEAACRSEDAFGRATLTVLQHGLRRPALCRVILALTIGRCSRLHASRGHGRSTARLSKRWSWTLPAKMNSARSAAGGRDLTSAAAFAHAVQYPRQGFSFVPRCQTGQACTNGY